MNKLLMAIVLVVLGGCGGGDKFDDVLKEMESFKTKMCACTDSACADKVQEDWRAYRKTMKDKVGKDAKPSDTQDKKGRALDDEIRACRKKHDKPVGGEKPAAEAPTPTESAPK